MVPSSSLQWLRSRSIVVLLMGLLPHFSSDFVVKVGHPPDNDQLQRLLKWIHLLAEHIVAQKSMDELHEVAESLIIPVGDDAVYRAMVSPSRFRRVVSQLIAKNLDSRKDQMYSSDLYLAADRGDISQLAVSLVAARANAGSSSALPWEKDSEWLASETASLANYPLVSLARNPEASVNFNHWATDSSTIAEHALTPAQQQAAIALCDAGYMRYAQVITELARGAYAALLNTLLEMGIQFLASSVVVGACIDWGAQVNGREPRAS